jgi:hypothetical protein
MSLVKLLLDSGADINGCGGRYWTPLQAACVIGEAQLVVSLLHKHADPNIIGGEWGTALQAVLVHHPDPDVEAVEKGGVYDPDDAPFAMPFGLRPYALCVLIFRVFAIQDLAYLAGRQAPSDTGLLLAFALLEYGADPTVLAGPWGTAIHAAAYFSSWATLRVVLDAKYSTTTTRTVAVNTAGGMMGLAINGPVIAGRWDKNILLLRDARAEYRYMPLLGSRIRKISMSAFERLCSFLGILWTLRDVLVLSIIGAVTYAVSFPIYIAWGELDRKAKEWDPRLGGLWMLVSLLAAGYVNNLRQNWAEDSAW